MGIKEQLKELEKAYSKMLEFKKQKDSPIIMSKNVEIVEVDPNKITPHNKG